MKAIRYPRFTKGRPAVKAANAVLYYVLLQRLHGDNRLSVIQCLYKVDHAKDKKCSCSS